MSDPKVASPSDDGGVKWLLGGLLVRKMLSIAKSLLANELDVRDWMAPETPHDFSAHDELWFDFMADTGDDPYVMMQLARSTATAYEPNALGDHPALPVGRFLLLGGDTAYVTPDETTLRYRVVEPFRAAHRSNATRTIYAIPGNHDYYDGLVGFNRMFRRAFPDPKESTVLPLDGYTVDQEATYIKLLMPGDWQLWAVDIGPHGLDFRQLQYFRPKEAPAKLIVCAHAPAIASDRLVLTDKELEAYQLLLGTSEAPAFTPKLEGVQPPDSACRLFLAGHVHHYARYDGQTNGARAPTRSATVVSGAGGSFIHPTEHSCGDIAAATKYPDEKQSRELTAAALTSPWQVFRGGYLWMLGAALALLLHATWPQRWDEPGPIAWLATVLLSFGIVAGGTVLTAKLGERRARIAKAARGKTANVDVHPNGRRLASAIIPASIAIALALPFVSHEIVEEMHPLAFASVWFVLAAVLVIGLAVVGAVVGGPPHRVAFFFVGLIHGGLQLALPHLLMQRGWRALVAAAIAWVVLGQIGAELYRRRARVLLVVWWLAQGVGVAAMLRWMPWLGHRQHGADLWLLAGIAGVLTILFQFGNYVLVVSAWNGHCNEAGITTRSMKYKQWIRFHVTKDKLVGYVIGLDEPREAGADGTPRARVVDVFTIAP